MNPFQKFLLFVKSLFVKEVHAVDNILADFKKTVARLESAITHHSQKAVEHSEAAQKALAAESAAVAEAARAQATAEKIKNLIS